MSLFQIGNNLNGQPPNPWEKYPIRQCHFFLMTSREGMTPRQGRWARRAVASVGVSTCTVS